MEIRLFDSGRVMSSQGIKGIIEAIIHPAGITIDGSNPWDMHINDQRFLRRVLSEGSIGLGESYMDGWWDCDHLDEFFSRLMPMKPEDTVKKNVNFKFEILKSALFNKASKSRAFTIGEKHYDIGNDLFGKMLDKRMVYSCGYWNNVKNLDEAQEAKLDLTCRKLGLRPGDKVLDIGCGWGSFCRYASRRYEVSKEQVSYAREYCKGLPVEIRLQDYRELDETFDHVVSIGMFEHVCHKNYRKYMEIVHRCLKDQGIFLLHTIGNNYSTVSVDPWIGKYIFPNSMIPSMKQISEAVERLFVIEDWHNFGMYYDPTLMSWFHNFDQNWHDLNQHYDDRFYRMWKYYLLSSAGTFRSRCLQVWQIVLSKNGIPAGYTPVR
jgi:cyclopropane-fatty-acyl-phospholipid synthase